MTTQTHPYCIFVWQPPLTSRDRGKWIEPLRAYTQEYALYVANLIHQDTRSVIKVVRYGNNIQCWPSAHAVELCEKQITREKHRPEPPRPSWLDK